MKYVLIIFVIQLSVLASAATSFILQGEADLSEWTTTEIGQFLIIDQSIKASAQVSFKQKPLIGKVSYRKASECTAYDDARGVDGESDPNCIQQKTIWVPELILETSAQVQLSFLGQEYSLKSNYSLDLMECSSNRQALVLIQDTEPLVSPDVVIMSDSCSVYLFSEDAVFKGFAKKYKNAAVSGFTRISFENLKVNWNQPIVIKNGLMSESDRNMLIKSIFSDLKVNNYKTEVEVQLTVKNKAGSKADLFNYPLTIELK